MLIPNKIRYRRDTVPYACLRILTRVWIHERFTRDLIWRGNLDPQILPNSKEFWSSMQHALLDIHFMALLKELTRSKFLRIITSPCKIRSLVQRSWIQALSCEFWALFIAKLYLFVLGVYHQLHKNITTHQPSQSKKKNPGSFQSPKNLQNGSCAVLSNRYRYIKD